MSLFDQLRALLDAGAEDEDRVLPDPQLESFDLDGVAKFLKSDKCKNVIVMTGAGLSTAAGIPDFRTPGTGLYDNLQKYNLSRPEAIFSIDFFRENPEPFYALAKELYPGTFKPTVSHYFIRLLNEKGLLLRNYTQNIDTLERIAGIPGDKLLEAHGSFSTGHCIQCKEEYSQDWIKEKVFADEIPTCTVCQGYVKPDIVFFGEALPQKFHESVPVDFAKCDLLIVMGTSLVVHPFAGLVSRVTEECPRLLINREKAGEAEMFNPRGMQFDQPKNYRDVFHQADCDEGCLKLAEMMGWRNELEEMVSREQAKLVTPSASAASTSSPTEPAAKPEESTATLPAAAEGTAVAEKPSTEEATPIETKHLATDDGKTLASSAQKGNGTEGDVPLASVADSANGVASKPATAEAETETKPEAAPEKTEASPPAEAQPKL